jgi:hypothetical protein
VKNQDICHPNKQYNFTVKGELARHAAITLLWSRRRYLLTDYQESATESVAAVSAQLGSFNQFRMAIRVIPKSSVHNSVC